MGIDGAIQPVDGYSGDVGYPDMNATAIPATRRPGWEPDTDVAVASLSFGDAPVAICPRNALVRATDAWRAIGFEPHLGYELEFYVFTADADAPGGWRPAGGPAHRVYGTGPFSDPTGLLITYYDLVEAMDLGLEGVMAEFSPGQMEINLRYGPALDADRPGVRLPRDGPRGRRRARLPGELHGAAGRDDRRQRSPREPVGDADRWWSERLLRHGGSARAQRPRPAQHRRPDRAPRCHRRLVSAARQQLQAPATRADRRVLVELGPRQPEQHLPRAGRTGWGDPDREPDAVWHGQPVPRRRRRCSTPPCSVSSASSPARNRRRATATASRTPTGTRRTRSPRRSTPSKPTRRWPRRWDPSCVRAHLALRRYELGRWEAAGETWDPETIAAWELEAYLPYY